MPDGSSPPLALHEALTRNTGFLISRMGLTASRAFAERISEVGVTPRGWGALNVLDTEGAITQQSLGRCIGMDPSTMVATIDELEAAGMVERRRNPQDRRAHALHITDKGRQTLKDGRKVARRAQEEFLAPLSSEERQQLHELLLRLAQAGAQTSAAAGAHASAATSSERAAAG
jgi:MarR family transcriptional regulator, lower aerobic nicotinate degradation pathway regulator